MIWLQGLFCDGSKMPVAYLFRNWYYLFNMSPGRFLPLLAVVWVTLFRICARIVGQMQVVLTPLFCWASLMQNKTIQRPERLDSVPVFVRTSS